MSTLRILVVGVAIAFLSAALLERWLRAHPDPQAPPVLYPRVPFIGHIIGLLTEGANYYKITSLMGPAEIKYQGSIVLDQISQRLDALPADDRPLFEWCRDLFVEVTTYAFYGPENPFELYPGLVKDYWVWEDEMIGVMASPLPQVTNRKAYLAREKVAKTMIEYVERERYTKASPVIQERIRLHKELGISLEDRGRSEFGMLFGALVNGSITVFWVLNYIFSRPPLVEDLRAEIQNGAFSVDHSTKTATISFEGLRDACPLLNSVFRETLRLIAPMTSARFVTEDTIVADTYKLRAQSVVQIAGGVLHGDEEVWGPDSREFNPQRFISTPNGTKTGSTDADKRSVHPAAFRGFGGGTVFCPGRHFAQIEILSLVAGLLMGWDFDPPKGAELIEWDPPKDEKRIPIGVMKPLRDVVVSIKRRDEMRGLRWLLRMS
ncbi:hypothetical protein SLS60_002271 [Paraconiothyrium brasiliense]|uniref:Cytochrome P450 n=1 Tax=Paraconiothyrium brasiliense TaxID=300254 RepID=A0ABR3S1P2_9PLEO